VTAAGRVGLRAYGGSGAETVHYFDDLKVELPGGRQE
jgi:hypothetical protein